MNPVQSLLGKAGKWAIDKTPDVMKQDDRWNNRYNEVKAFIEERHRNPSKYVGEERNMYSFVKHCRKLMNQGLMK